MKAAEVLTELWYSWNIRSGMLASLLIQIFLTILAPCRKYSSDGILKGCIWMLYLSADAVALFTISLIAKSDKSSPQPPDLLSFWAPFLLLHLGGPDTITSLSLEDNELWTRHVLQLVSQLVVTLFVLGRSLRDNTALLLPTLLMFVDGLIKYVERTQALYFSSIERFRESFRTAPEPGPDYAMFMAEYSAGVAAHIPTNIQDRPKRDATNFQENERYGSNIESENRDNDVNDPEVENKMIKDANVFYTKYKGLLADSLLTLKHRTESRSFFLSTRASKAFRIIQIELNLIYDVFYTKTFLLQKKQAYLRTVSFISVVASLLIFCWKNKGNYHTTDVVLTYILLGAAIALDITVSLMFVVSDWYIIITDPSHKILKQLRFLVMKLLQSIFSCKACDWRHRRWSNSMSKYNLLERAFSETPSWLKLVFVKSVRDALIGFLYVQNVKFSDDKFVVKFIVEELNKKAKLAPELKESKEIHSARGNLALEDEFFLVSEYLNPWTVDLDYDESVLIWHLATDICYWTSNDNDDDDDDGFGYRSFCKKVSDYMTYILLQQSSLVSLVVGMSETRFEDTCAEIKKFMNQRLDQQLDDSKNENKDLFVEFCNKVLKVKAHVRPVVAKGDKSKSVLFDACRLAEQLKMFGSNQWEITYKVWVELLCYAANRCTPRSHIAQLKSGGELITIVWLLMAHLGLGERFLQNQGFGWTKLIIHK